MRDILNSRKLRLAYFVTHPIQYQAPLLRRIAREPDIDLKVFFGSDLSVRGYVDQGFGVAVKWDTPLLEGYEHEFLPAFRDSDRITFLSPLNHGIKGKLKGPGFDAVWAHGYSNSSTLQAIRAASSLKIPVLLRAESTLHDRPRSRWKLAAKNLFFRWLTPRISAVLSIGEDNASYWRHYFGAQMPIFPFYYSVDNEFFQRESFRASRSREDFRRSLDLEPGRPVILYASKLQARKRCSDLVEAFLAISKAGRIQPSPYLLIVGDGEERADLETRAAGAAPGDIRFLGFRNQSELPRFYDLCNVFVLASVDEPWGLVVNEVMNAGRAVIVTDQVGCQKDLVKPGVNGFVIPPRDIGTLADSLEQVLLQEGKWSAMGAQSRRIIDDFSFEQNVRGLRQALHTVVPAFPAVAAAIQEGSAQRMPDST